MKYIVLVGGIIILLILASKVILPITSQPVPVSTPTPTPQVVYIEPTDTPTPIPTSIPVHPSFTSPLYCQQIYLEGVTPCVDANKTPVACVAQFHPDGSPIINLICGFPGNSESAKGCVNYTNNPNIVICP